MGAEDFDKMQAYKIANGQVNANPLVDKDGMINLAMDYESEQESEGIVQKIFRFRSGLSRTAVGGTSTESGQGNSRSRRHGGRLRKAQTSVLQGHPRTV